jgi:3-deoxy-D-manno-octulosonate 8-phosphate phosphatase (KDO 8-P phosphatase)
MDNTKRARRIKMILMDVDGTLTDGTLTLLPDGEELKSYHVRDGMGILMAHLAGFQTGIITGKTSKALEFRAARLRIPELHQGVLDKAKVFQAILQKYRFDAEEVAYIGDDLGDIPVLVQVGLAGAVADSHPRVIESSHFICQNKGGKGAVREFLEFIFEAQDKWPLIQDKLGDMTGVKV